jgi:hypothetical protein
MQADQAFLSQSIVCYDDSDDDDQNPFRHAVVNEVLDDDNIPMSLTLNNEYPQLARIASRLLLLHATSCSTERLWSLLRWVYRDNRSRLGFEKARKMALLAMFRRSQAKNDDLFEDDLLLEWFLDQEEEENEEIIEIDDLIECLTAPL